MIKEIMKENKVGKKVKIRGWVYRKRNLKNKIFLVVRDSSGIIQCVIKKENKNFDKAKKIQIEGSLEVEGTLERDKRAPGGYEIKISKMKVFDYGEIFPLKGNEKPEAILNWRHLWIRSRKFVAISKIRNALIRGMINYFEREGWYWTFPPILTPSACEGTTELFEVKYFGKKAYLSQSAQLYLEALIFSLEKVFSFTPSFRAEMSRTKRHLHEFWHLEAEAAWMNMKEMMKVTEEVIKEGIREAIKLKDEFKILGRDVEKVRKYVNEPFEVMTYDEAIEELEKKGLKIKWGDDLGADEERELTLTHENPIFVIRYPRMAKAFYMKESGNGRTVENFDLLAPEGYGEIVGGSQREDNYDILMKKIKEFKLNPPDYRWYLDLRKYGSVPHSGFGIGVDRLTMWITGIEHIRETLPFPRLRSRWLQI